MLRSSPLPAAAIALVLGGCAAALAVFREPDCQLPPDPPPHPVYSAAGLQLIMDDAYGLMELIHLIADTRDTVISPMPMELEIYSPDGSKRVIPFMHHNAVRFANGCDPSSLDGRTDGCEHRRAEGEVRVQGSKDRQVVAWLGDTMFLAVEPPGLGDRADRFVRALLHATPPLPPRPHPVPRCSEVPALGKRAVATAQPEDIRKT